MMTRRIESEIKGFRDLLLDKKLAVAGNPLVTKTIGDVKRITWAASATSSSPVTEFDFASVQEYLHQLEANAYTVILFDGSVIQVSVDIRREKVVGHRFCFFPSPFDFQPKDLLELPILDLAKLYGEAGTDYLRLRSPLRFEYDPKNASESHPVCHVHLLWSHCRCSVTAPISLGHFIKFIFSHFYPETWKVHSFLREWPTLLGTRTITTEQESVLHFACARDFSR